MAACKAMVDAAHGIEGSTIVSVMARNGTDFGIRVSGLGDRWFTAPVAIPQGLYFPGFKAEDASGDIGDSTITETAGIGGFAMAAAPAIVTFVSGTPKDAMNATLEMYEICHSRAQVPLPFPRWTFAAHRPALIFAKWWKRESHLASTQASPTKMPGWVR